MSKKKEKTPAQKAYDKQFRNYMIWTGIQALILGLVLQAIFTPNKDGFSLGLIFLLSPIILYGILKAGKDINRRK